MDTLTSLAGAFFGDFGLRLMPLYLGTMLAIGWALYALRFRGRERPGFLGWLLPRDIYFHPSHIVDIKLFALSRVMAVAGFLNVVFIRTGMAILVVTLIGRLTGMEMSDDAWSWGRILFATLLIAVVSDFCTYWVHRIHHENPVLWPFHSLHHSAEVLTPVTVYRKHPVYDLISEAFGGALIGAVSGVLLVLFSSSLDIYSIGGANAVYVAFNALGANFRHSHIWISYGRALEHVFVSPAQHQIHHSRAVIHHDRNYGEIFAIWDWMFGTLYIPEEQEILQFGIGDEHGHKIDQPHPSLVAALIEPLKESYNELRGIRKTAEQVTPAE